MRARQPSSAAGPQPLKKPDADAALEGHNARSLPTQQAPDSPEAVLSLERAFFEPSTRALTLCFPIVYDEMTTWKGGKTRKLNKRHQNTTTTNPMRWEVALKEEWMRGCLADVSPRRTVAVAGEDRGQALDRHLPDGAFASILPLNSMDCRQEEIVQSLMASYCEVGGINHVDCGALPSKQAIASLCEDLLQVLFPGFYSEDAVSSQDLELMTHELVASIRERLRTEVRRSLRLRDQSGNHHEEAMKLVCDFMVKLPEVRRLLQTDVQAAYEGDPAARSYEEIILAYPGPEAIAVQRTAHLLYTLGVPLIPRMMTEWAHGRTGIDIHPGAQIGSHFFIDHGTGVVIGETCSIGSRVKLYQGVGLVARSLAQGQALAGKKRHPTIEDNVTIYAGATIVGGDTIVGARSTIGANVFLMESVAPDMVYALGDQEHRIRDRKSTPVTKAPKTPEKEAV
jgi:serine O-acetyltransferase